MSYMISELRHGSEQVNHNDVKILEYREKHSLGALATVPVNQQIEGIKTSFIYYTQSCGQYHCEGCQSASRFSCPSLLRKVYLFG